MADIFISYANAWRETAGRLAKDLETAGYSVWWDTGLLPNQKFRSEIDAQLKSCKATIVIWTSESIQSDWVIAEADDARIQGKLINTRVPEVDPRQIPKPFNQFHVVQVSDRAAIIAAAKNLIARHDLSAEAMAENSHRSAPTLLRVPDTRWQAFARDKRMTLGLVGLSVVAALIVWKFGFIFPASSPATAPQWALEQDMFIGKPVLLKWQFDRNKIGNPNHAGALIFFEIESADDSAFRSKVKREPVYADGFYLYVSNVNATRFWRVRAVDGRNKQPLSDWSLAAVVTQYDSAYRRILSVRRVMAYVSSSENQDVFKWLDTKFHGFDIKLVEAIAGEISNRSDKGGTAIEVQFIPVPWAELLDTPSDGRADMAIATISKRRKREQDHQINFSDTYYCTTQSLVFRVGEAERPVRETVESKRVGFQKLTTSEQLVAALGEEISFSTRPFDRAELMIHAILSGEIDYGVVDTPFAAASQLASRENGKPRLGYREFKGTDSVKSLPPDEQRDEYAIGVRRDDELLPVINEILAKFKKDGTLSRLLKLASEEFEDARHIPRTTLSSEVPSDRPWECFR